MTNATATVSGATGTCTIADGQAVCVIDAIADDAQATITVTGTLTQASAGFPLLLTASASAAQPDGDSSNDAASATASIGAQSNVGLAVLAPTTPVLTGQVVDYSMSVSNSGPSDAQDVVITQTLPTGAVLIELDRRCTQTGQTVTCNLGTIGAGQSIVVEFSALALSPFDGAQLGAIARVSSSTADADGSNNTTAKPARRCLSRRNFDIRLRVPLAARKLKVLVGSKAAKVWRKGGRLRAKIDLRGHLTEHVTVKITAISPRGFAIHGSRRYRTCDIKRASKRAPKI
jgi:uncharacterized repeat protein (TIGR01451 family)